VEGARARSRRVRTEEEEELGRTGRVGTEVEGDEGLGRTRRVETEDVPEEEDEELGGEG
jgi:hypothetical protein